MYSSLFELSILLAKDFSFAFVFPTKHRKETHNYFQFGHSTIRSHASAWVTTLKTNMRQGTRCNDAISGFSTSQSFSGEFRSKPLMLLFIFGSDVIRSVPRAVGYVNMFWKKSKVVEWLLSIWSDVWRKNMLRGSVSPQGAHTICLCNRCNFMVNVLYLPFASSVAI